MRLGRTPNEYTLVHMLWRRSKRTWKHSTRSPPHRLYSSNITPPDDHLFRSKANGLSEQHSYEDTKQLGVFDKKLSVFRKRNPESDRKTEKIG